MKKILGTFVLIVLALWTNAQTQKVTVSGKVIDAETQQPVANATIRLNGQIVIADDAGKFNFKKLNKHSYSLKVTSIGFTDYETEIKAEQDVQITIPLKSMQLFLQPLEVKALRAGAKAPFAKTNISKDDLAKINIGQDLPILLNQTPSVYTSSDAGNGVGYTYLHIRGTDATRINVTLNGIPYNDAESQGTYFVDLPDFTSSVSSIQIQRGVGTSSNGTGAFGASINLSTNEFNEKPYAELNNSFGSFNTFKNTIKAGSGLIDGHFTIDARMSRITSDGYIDRASSDLKSMALSMAYINKNSSLRFNIFTGKEKTYQAWYGIDAATLATDRTYNPAGTEKPGAPYDNQTDNYQQDHYQLFFNHAFNSRWSFNTALFLTYGRGYYEEYKAAQSFSDYGLLPFSIGGNQYDSTDLVRQRWLDNYFYGQIASLQYKNKKDEITIGGGWTRYDGTHFGNIVWAQYGIDKGYQYYNYPALKTDENIYVKWQHQLSAKWFSYADVQYRNVYHRMDGFEGNGTLNIARTFNFVNPKAGITYSSNGWQAYASYALGQKEPNRDDFQASPIQQPNAEMLHDFELGIDQRNTLFQWSANVYYMLYKNQLVLTGKINDVGAYTRTNVPNSYRLGIELQAGYTFTKWLRANANLTLSKNKIKDFTEYIDNWDNGSQETVQHHNTDISFSPSVISGATITIIPYKQAEIDLIGKYVSKQYVDNTQDAARSLNAFYTQDVRASWTIKKLLFKEWSIIAQVNNIFNKMYEPNGWSYAYIYNGQLNTDRGYYPMAGTNFMLALNIKL
ncbi:MAG: TonB-dependent receptor [Bacteroidota bacterium]|nr:TonB-dependent receptor [Bacteroidota bacterium]